MFETGNNDANQGGGVNTNPNDQSFDLQNFEEYDDITFDGFEETSAENNGDVASSSGQGNNTAQPNNNADAGKNGEVIKNAFDDLETDDKGQPKPNTDAEEDTDALIAKLEAKGIKVQKPEESNEEVEFNTKLQQAETAIKMANDFINLPDKEIVFEKIKNDLANKYHQVGRGNEIGQEQFQLELEAEMDQYDGNTAMLKIYADNIRNTVKSNSLSKAVSEKEALVSERRTKIEGQIKQNDIKLKTAFNEFHTKSFFGIEVSKETAQEAFDYIKTGQLSKEIKQSPQLLAKVALFFKHEKEISEKLGSPTYGEGVADVVKQFTSDAKDTSRISAAMQSAGAGQGTGKVRDWSSTLSGDSEEVKKKESF